MEQHKETIIPKDFIIKFSQDQQVKLEYIGEAQGVFKYETSYIDTECAIEGEVINLIISIEYSFSDYLKK
ncbi:MAG: hypothetical protein A3F72_03695 [Bacteroidetes bacterium RIFCSPLOWO2_12_FULL_35_15]|nr:MAG: hypothetical protein A3F72_03695 [Bacteroidetes bacterium RIFCSPLOWO2_12_FULL_35_15]